MQFAEQMLAVMDLNAIMARSLTASMAEGDFGKIEPRWRDFFVEAMGEEIKADHAAIAATLGRAFARSFTAEELNAGIVVFQHYGVNQRDELIAQLERRALIKRRSHWVK